MVDCTSYETGLDALKDEAVRNAIGCAYEAQFGSVEVFGLMIMAAVGLAMYIRTDSIVVPWATFMVTGSVILPIVAAPGVAIATLLVAGVGAAAPLLLIRRMKTP
jgi:hypothetical protein